MARLMLVLDREEIQKNICYPLICETMFGSRWGTGSRKRKWLAQFNERERRACSKLGEQAYDWYLRHGVPDKVRMYPETLVLWHKLEAFCASL